jgi:hypothetical protein
MMNYGDNLTLVIPQSNFPRVGTPYIQFVINHTNATLSLNGAPMVHQQ